MGRGAWREHPGGCTMSGMLKNVRYWPKRFVFRAFVILVLWLVPAWVPALPVEHVKAWRDSCVAALGIAASVWLGHQGVRRRNDGERD